MKKAKQMIAYLMALMVLIACGSSNGSSATDAATEEANIQQLDSLSNELETTANSIDEKAKALEEALNELEDN